MKRLLRILEWILRAIAGIFMVIGWMMLVTFLGLGKVYAFFGILCSIFLLDSESKKLRKRNVPPAGGSGVDADSE